LDTFLSLHRSDENVPPNNQGRPRGFPSRGAAGTGHPGYKETSRAISTPFAKGFDFKGPAGFHGKNPSSSARLKPPCPPMEPRSAYEAKTRVGLPWNGLGQVAQGISKADSMTDKWAVSGWKPTETFIKRLILPDLRPCLCIARRQARLKFQSTKYSMYSSG